MRRPALGSPAVAPPPAPRGSALVLIVEDNKDMTPELASALRLEGTAAILTPQPDPFKEEGQVGATP
jgi:hypothetical protein